MKKTFLILLAFLIALTPPPARATQEKKECVVLLHGIGRTKKSMAAMEAALSKEGYETINIDYASRQKKIEALVEDVRKDIETHPACQHEKTHFIGYSMGGLLTRAYVAKHRPENMGRVVMLGTPNRGSEVADFLSGTSIFKAVYGPAGEELVTNQKAFGKIFGKTDYDIGVIAGDRSIDPISSLLILPGPDDGKVTVARTKLKGMKDHIVLHVTHTFMPQNEDVIHQASWFLAHGKFERKMPEDLPPKLAF